MSRHQLVLARMASCVALGLILSAGVSGCVTGASHADKTPIQVTVTVDASGMPEVKPDPTPAHEGNRVHWVFQGPSAKEFAVKFTNVADSPFDWSEQKGTQIWGTVKAGAAKDNRRTEYKYSVDVNGKALDPKIIIEPKAQ
jgi:hypothetical protein